MPSRCPWATSPLLIEYHDTEWGAPVHDDRRLFEMLTLEGAQAGLSWETILRKRDGYRSAFREFDPQVVARFNVRMVERLMQDTAIVRNRLKVESTIANARAIVRIQKGGGSLDELLWSFAPAAGGSGPCESLEELPAKTAESSTMSRALKQRGFRFVGPTVCYALMQAAGMVNDHLAGCFRRAELLTGPPAQPSRAADSRRGAQ